MGKQNRGGTPGLSMKTRSRSRDWLGNAESDRSSFVSGVFFASRIRLCGVVGGFGGAATSGKERRNVLQELSAVGMFQRQRGFSDGESPFVISLGIRMQTLASTKTPQAMQTERHVRMSSGKLGFTDLQGLIEQGVRCFELRLFGSNIGQMICREHSIQAGAAAEFVVNQHGLRQTRIRFGQA